MCDNGDWKQWKKEERIVRRLERDGRQEDMTFVKSQLQESDGLENNFQEESVGTSSRRLSHRGAVAPIPKAKQQRRTIGVNRAQYSTVPGTVAESPRSRSLYGQSPQRSSFYLHSPQRPFFLHGAQESAQLLGPEAQFSVMEPTRRRTQVGALRVESPRSGSLYRQSPQRSPFYLHSPQRPFFLHGAQESAQLFGPEAQFSVMEPTRRGIGMGAHPQLRSRVARRQLSDSDILNDSLTLYDSLLSKSSNRGRPSPCRRPPQRDLVDVMDMRTPRALSGSSVHDIFSDIEDSSDSDADYSYDGTPQGLSFFWTDPEVFYGPEKLDATYDYPNNTVFSPNPECDNQTFELGPGSDQTFVVGPGSDQTFVVGPGSDQTFEVGPGCDQTFEVGPGCDRTFEVDPGCDRTFEVPPLSPQDACAIPRRRSARQRHLSANDYTLGPANYSPSRWSLSLDEDEDLFDPVGASSPIMSSSFGEHSYNPVNITALERAFRRMPHLLDSRRAERAQRSFNVGPNPLQPMRTSAYLRGLQAHPSIFDSSNTPRARRRLSLGGNTAGGLRTSASQCKLSRTY